MVNFAVQPHEGSPELTTNRRGIILGGCGRTCERFALARKSMIAGVVFALFNDACRSCTFGNSSEMTSITGSSGNLSSHLSKEWKGSCLNMTDAPLLPGRDPFLCGHESISPNSAKSDLL